MQTTGASIASDGWDDRQGRPLLNVVLITAQGAMFIKSVDTSGEIKSAHYIAQVLGEAIEEAGVENVVQVITDNAANCKAAGRILEERYPSVTWTGCAAHSVDLFLEDIGKHQAVKDIVDKAKLMIKTIVSHHASRHIYNTHSPNFALLRPGDTR